ncbi:MULTISPECIES: hypothetical protein [unclassified Mycobacterium]|uniref:hypothetical protein n=1 Tax=unclassified Mycobacterium TaxID=2642494 RepID=UPI0029C84CE8|nr:MULTISPECIES: hypothetical protein [unclassified Mycobacterium]
MKWVEVLRDRFTIGVIAAAVILAGVIALQWQVHLAAYDRWGFHIGCGTGLQADYDQATRADDAAGPTTSTDYTGQCRSAIVWRRVAAGSLVLLGAAALIALIPRHAKVSDTSTKSTAGSHGMEET